ncbi:FAD-binding oxidoreductase [Allokutzneria sp. A3M-2-11 16]|uniref:FAD-binding and (Fe-S)-binding domain-containing protein n=1 Tax=Allokutzneria sp. A3M-2-11 16 TaxID=2962043 RepID=UPI0020B6B9F2|nr:FAD-linked oxidase C-terminal domain-containing protein [Allokutzneria sp. A3M-2-11 16]MCP3803660.1 FAD-binding oxidoreductase [Allokutzneria sp. A3M-2-11 16]
MSTDSFVRTLRAELAGDVLDDDGTRAAYACDASNHRVLPRCVVLPRDTEDVVRVVQRCAEAGVPLTSRGAGTNIAGNAIGPGVVMDFSRHLRAVQRIDPDARTAVVQPGVVLDDLRRQAAVHGLTFGVDPSTHSRCTLGGMIGTNACGSHSVAWGTTADNVESLDVVLADGTSLTMSSAGPLAERLTALRDSSLALIRTELGRFPRQISGYGLQYLLPEKGFDLARAVVGSEGTCAVVTSATVGLVVPPKARVLVTVGFPDAVAAAAAAPRLAGMGTLTVEGMDDELVRAFDSRPRPGGRPALPPGRAWLLVEVGGDDLDEAMDRARQVSDVAGGATTVVTDVSDQAAFWRIREQGAGLATRTADGRETWPGWEDSAVPPEHLAAYLGDFRELLGRYGRAGVVYGHFGEGCVHVRIDHDLLSPSGRADYRSFQTDAADLVVAHEGSLSGEHGDGRARSELLARMYSAPMLSAFAAFKHAFDPSGLFNPGVLVDPAPLDADLRVALSRPHTIDLGFAYESDGGDLGKALRRCVGVGACRRTEGGGMCPSFRATRDERHSTRGRARILFEMLNGHIESGWKSADVAEALDMCLGCKACRSECPVTVDMATYKAEFLHQHHRGRIRPASHYSMGWLPLWLAAGRLMPRVANALLALPGLKWLGGIDKQRALPRLSTLRLRPWLRRRTASRDGEEIVLWIDSFTSSFSPEVVIDAIAVLEAAGYRVRPSAPGLCCGLTWISTGQLGVAKRVLRRTVRKLDGLSDARPIVALEPSCAVALRADLPELVAGQGARRVASRIRTLAEMVRGLPFAEQEPITAVTQFHCHQRAVLGTEADREVLSRAGVSLDSVEEGCCGLAGNFGFEKGHFEVSKTCAEQSFLPHLGNSELVLADGFSCRLQIEQFGDRRPLHLAQLLRRRLAEVPQSSSTTNPAPGSR